MKYIMLIVLFFSLYSCKDEDEKDEIIQVPYEIYIIPGTVEVVMEDSQEWERINYFNVIKRSDGTWQMWYAAYKYGCSSDYQSSTCYAYSIDGKNWIKEISDRNTNIIHSGFENYDG